MTGRGGAGEAGRGRTAGGGGGGGAAWGQEGHGVGKKKNGWKNFGEKNLGKIEKKTFF